MKKTDYLSITDAMSRVKYHCWVQQKLFTFIQIKKAIYDKERPVYQEKNVNVRSHFFVYYQIHVMILYCEEKKRISTCSIQIFVYMSAKKLNNISGVDVQIAFLLYYLSLSFPVNGSFLLLENHEYFSCWMHILHLVFE
jgi:hypothetical protein